MNDSEKATVERKREILGDIFTEIFGTKSIGIKSEGGKEVLIGNYKGIGKVKFTDNEKDRIEHLWRYTFKNKNAKYSAEMKRALFSRKDIFGKAIKKANSIFGLSDMYDHLSINNVSESELNEIGESLYVIYCGIIGKLCSDDEFETENEFTKERAHLSHINTMLNKNPAYYYKPERIYYRIDEIHNRDMDLKKYAYDKKLIILDMDDNYLFDLKDDITNNERIIFKGVFGCSFSFVNNESRIKASIDYRGQKLIFDLPLDNWYYKKDDEEIKIAKCFFLWDAKAEKAWEKYEKQDANKKEEQELGDEVQQRLNEYDAIQNDETDNALDDETIIRDMEKLFNFSVYYKVYLIRNNGEFKILQICHE